MKNTFTLKEAKIEALWIINKEYKNYRNYLFNKYNYATIFKNYDGSYDFMLCESGNYYNCDNIVGFIGIDDLNEIYDRLRDYNDNRFLTKKEIKAYIEGGKDNE